jgi:hypothetical protein
MEVPKLEKEEPSFSGEEGHTLDKERACSTSPVLDAGALRLTGIWRLIFATSVQEGNETMQSRHLMMIGEYFLCYEQQVVAIK